MSNDRVAIALAAMRLSLGVFFLVWALEKVFAPELAGKVATTFYGFAPGAGVLRAIGVAQVVLIAAFMLGLFKTYTYAAPLLIHTASVLSTWERLINPFEAPNHLFWAGVPVVAMLFALSLARRRHTLGPQVHSFNWRQQMTDAYPAASTGLILVDPYNEFLREGGKRWDAVKDVVLEIGLIANLARLLAGCRAAGVRVFYALHHQGEPGDFARWKAPSKSNMAMRDLGMFAKGSWGAEIHPDLVPRDGDIVARQHWNSSGFANTDLDFLLKQNGIDRIALAGMAANTCVESTGRHGLELGHHVTFLADGVATFSAEEQHAAVHLNYPRVSHAVLNIDAFLGKIETVPA